jgi:hypothetical protein
MVVMREGKDVVSREQTRCTNEVSFRTPTKLTLF